MPSDPKTGKAAPLETSLSPQAAAPSIAGSLVTEGPPLGPTPAPDPGAGGAGTPAPGPGAGPGGAGEPGPPGSSDTAVATTGETGDAFAGQAADTFLSLIANATSTDALEAQRIILRRIALQGDVVPSRVPPPRNITEIGG